MGRPGELHPADFDGRLLSLASNQTRWTCTVLATAFPPLDPHFAVPELHTVSCDRSEFRRAVESAAVLPGAPINLQGHGTTLGVSSESAELGHIDTNVTADAPTDLAASFAGSYLRDAVQLTVGETLTMSFTDKHATISCDHFTQLVMKVV